MAEKVLISLNVTYEQGLSAVEIDIKVKNKNGPSQYLSPTCWVEFLSKLVFSGHFY